VSDHPGVPRTTPGTPGTPTAPVPVTPAPRELSDRERELVVLMIDHATCVDTDERVEEAHRARWRAQVATTRAGRRCGCGTCPSVELTDAAGVTPEATSSRVVLGAELEQATVLLFIDDDRLSYLELAPTDERTYADFPDPVALRHT
jgi:hypothetical protein